MRENGGDTTGNFELIITQLQDGLFRYAFNRTGSYADAQDIVQEVFVKFYFDCFPSGKVTNYRSYLYRAVSNRCTDYWRAKNVTVPEQHVRTTATPEEDNSNGYSTDYETVAALLASFPPEQAEVIRMRTVGGLAFTDIAEILEVPVTTVKSRFKYGIDKIRTILYKKGGIL